MASAEDFAPFRKYVENADLLTKHLTATEVAYALAVATLSDQRVKSEKPGGAAKADSFTDADFAVGKVTRKYGWVSLEECAKLEGRTLDAVKADAAAGKLGRLAEHPEGGYAIVIWPKEKRGTPEADKLMLGNSLWSVQVREPKQVLDLSFDIDDRRSLAQTRRRLVHVGRDLGDAVDVYAEAQELTFRSIFLNLWSAFELFIRETFFELMRMYPSAMADLPDGKRAKLSYAGLVEQSLSFTNVEALRDSLLASEIARVEAGGQNVTGLINLLKSVFKWKHDPYKRKFVEKGKERATTFPDLSEIKEVRNCLAHQSNTNLEGCLKSKRLKTLDDRIIVTREYLSWATLVLTSIAHGMAGDIVGGKVVLRK
jgi:hypothetical protein